MKTTFLILLACVVWLTACCNKSEPKPLKKLDQQTKDYTVFLTNSLWVYQLRNTSIKDTNQINIVRSGNSFSDVLDYDYEEHETTAYSSYQNTQFLSSAKARSGIDDVVIWDMWFEGSHTSTKCLFFSNRSVGDTYNYWFYPDNVVTYQSFLPTYALEGKTYNEVMVFESIYTGASVPFDDVRLPVKVYFAKHIGIIRKEMKNGDVWNLIHHEVKQ